MGSFWHLTPHTLSLITDGYKIALKRQMTNQNAMAHLQGAYFVEALLATVGNMFLDKGSKKHNYPDKPYDLDLGLDSESEKEHKQSEKEGQLQLFAAQLTSAMHNFNLSQSKNEG